MSGRRRRVNPLVCCNGHDLADPANVYIDAFGRSICKVCRKLCVRRVRERHRALGILPTARLTPEEETVNAEVYLTNAERLENAPPWVRQAELDRERNLRQR